MSQLILLNHVRNSKIFCFNRNGNIPPICERVKLLAISELRKGLWLSVYNLFKNLRNYY